MLRSLYERITHTHQKGTTVNLDPTATLCFATTDDDGSRHLTYSDGITVTILPADPIHRDHLKSELYCYDCNTDLVPMTFARTA